MNIDVAHLARLARIDMNDTELSAAVADLQNIIAMIDQMQAVDTTNVAPMAHPLDATQRLRADAVTEVVDRDTYQAHAPEVADGYYLVPKVVE